MTAVPSPPALVPFAKVVYVQKLRDALAEQQQLRAPCQAKVSHIASAAFFVATLHVHIQSINQSINQSIKSINNCAQVLFDGSAIQKIGVEGYRYHSSLACYLDSNLRHDAPGLVVSPGRHAPQVPWVESGGLDLRLHLARN